ncbi:MAG: hypothetical protein Fur0037_14260 [Planctomycetota bacterium]
MAAVPSVLAIRDLRHRVRRCFEKEPVTDEVLEQMLSLDPPAAIRALRIARAPVYGSPDRDWTIASIAAALGTSLLRRTMDVHTIDVAGTGPIRVLWLHSVATALAARDLARSTGIWNPEQAYLAGLLHDLPLWMHYVCRLGTGERPSGSLADWLRHWNIPEDLSTLLLQLGHKTVRPGQPAPQNPITLVCAAELLAEIADFVHPDQLGSDAHDLILAEADKGELLAAQRLRRNLQNILMHYGLDLVQPDQPEAPTKDQEKASLRLFPGRQVGDLPEIVLSALSCSKANSYRSVVTAITGAALRYLAFDRAWFVKWVMKGDSLVVRAKADMSARRLHSTSVVMTQEEHDAFAASLSKDRPARIERRRDGGSGLLRWISADDVLVVPVNRDFASPTFLVLDRAVSIRPVHMVRDADKASTLGNLASLLAENLLLKLRRRRAQRFALTDPLTRLFNRGMGIKSLDAEIARANRTGEPLTVLMVDLDEFKKLNDRHGHLVGDQALRETADVLRKTMRKSDVICRYGGEEFLAVLPGTSPEQAAVLAARLFTAVESRGIELGLEMTVSIGMSALRKGDDMEALVGRADRALYASKNDGRNRFSVDVEDAQT